MPSWLLFILTIAGMLSVVPLVTWFATGSFRAALEAGRSYIAIVGGMAALAAVGAGIMLLASRMA